MKLNPEETELLAMVSDQSGVEGRKETIGYLRKVVYWHQNRFLDLIFKCYSPVLTPESGDRLDLLVDEYFKKEWIFKKDPTNIDLSPEFLDSVSFNEDRIEDEDNNKNWNAFFSSELSIRNITDSLVWKRHLNQKSYSENIDRKLTLQRARRDSQERSNFKTINISLH